MKLCFQAAAAGKTLFNVQSAYGGWVHVLEILLFLRRQPISHFNHACMQNSSPCREATSNYCLKCFKRNSDGSFLFWVCVPNDRDQYSFFFPSETGENTWENPEMYSLKGLRAVILNYLCTHTYIHIPRAHFPPFYSYEISSCNYWNSLPQTLTFELVLHWEAKMPGAAQAVGLSRLPTHRYCPAPRRVRSSTSCLSC